MIKKLSFLMAAVAVLAFAIPAMASASTGLTTKMGSESVLVPFNEKEPEKATTIIGTNEGTVTAAETGVGKLTCAKVELKGKLTKNGSSGVEGNSGGQTSKATTCLRNGETAITVDTITLEKLSSSSSETSTGKVTASYVAHVGGLNCKFQLTNATGTYVDGSSKITLTNQPQTVTSACGAGGKFTGVFNLETTAKAAVIIMS